MAEALYISDGEKIDWTADAAYSAGAVIQLRDGRAGVISCDVASGDPVGVYVKGLFTVLKTASMVVLTTSKLFWDHSANLAHLLHGNDKDFYLGCAMTDAAAADTTVVVNLNVQPVYTVSLEHGWAGVRVQTAGFVSGVGVGREGWAGAFSATAEAQKTDALTYRSVPAANLNEGIFHALICVNDGGDDAALDFNVGIANETHASDLDGIAASVFVHIDGNSANINIESDDATTEVASTDTTLDYTAGTPFLAQFDCRNPAAVLVYINGVRVCDGTTGTARTFNVAAAANPWKVLAHLEKSSNDTPGNVTVCYAGLATAQV